MTTKRTKAASAKGRTRRAPKVVPCLPKPHQPHRGEPVKVGAYTIFLGGTQYLRAEDLAVADVLLPLTEVPLAFGSWHQLQQTDPSLSQIRGLPPFELNKVYNVLAAPLKDFGGVPDNWGQFLSEVVIPLLASGKKVLAFCIGSHGRTGTFLASLIALVEPEVEDPIAEARKRHCEKAVETKAQAKAVFALKGIVPSDEYLSRFHY